MERKYNIKQKGEKVVIEEINRRLQAKSAKLKRYQKRIHRYQVNRLFQQDQKRVYQQMNGTSRNFNEVRPDAEESQQFWRDVWGKEISHNENAEWLKELKKERVEARQEDIVITAEMEGLCRVRRTKKGVVLLIIVINPYPVYHLFGN